MLELSEIMLHDNKIHVNFFQTIPARFSHATAAILDWNICKNISVTTEHIGPKFWQILQKQRCGNMGFTCIYGSLYENQTHFQKLFLPLQSSHNQVTVCKVSNKSVQ